MMAAGDERRDEVGGPSAVLDPAARARVVALADDPQALEARLAALDEEWDIERVLEVNALAVSVVGTGLGFVRKRRLLPLGVPAAVAVFVLQHAIRGVRPPESLLRRMGFRSAAEIEGERLALFALRGGAPMPVRERPGLASAVARRGMRAIGR